MNAERLTQKSAEAIRSAQQIAQEYGNPQIEQVHLLWALLQDSEGLIPQLLSGMGVTVPSLEAAVKNLLERQPRVSSSGHEAGKIYISAETEKALNRAEKIAGEMKDEYTSVEHLFLGLLETAGRELGSIFSEYRITKERALQALTSVRGNQRVTSDNPEETYGALKKYGSDLVERARQNKLDPVIGRDDEIRNVIRILSRKSKNNPVLIGEPGVGKTAIAEGLAQRIASADVPEELLNKKLLSLDLSGMVAGTKYRGEFEERIKNALDEVKKDGNVILFIDELHTIVGAGSAEGAVDAANIIKPALGRGEIRVVGATTLNEYRKYIEKDAALERRFQPVTVGEPSAEDTVAILKGLRDKYEAHHKLTITDEALEAAVSLSRRYINDRFLPDKAIDLMDEAASQVRMKAESASPDLKSLEEKIAALHREKAEAITAQDYEKAAQLRDIEKNYTDQVEIERDNWRRKLSQNRGTVTADDIANVVAGWTGIPVNRLTEDESLRLLRLEETLHQRVVGQDEAVTAVARAIRRGRVGLKDPKRPIGSFLFLGPTGVGKTELCKALAEAMFGDENAMIRIDMSEYMERHTVSRLVGSPPGYVGHEEGGQLTEKVRRKPYSVVLFDEIEKAHEDVWNILLQILEDGIVTDSQGRRVDFKNTVIVMTSNVGAKNITAAENAPLGFDGSEKQKEANETARFARIREAVMAELKRTFKPEFLNRIDETIVFRQLTEEDIVKIAHRMLSVTGKRMAQQGITLVSDEDAVAALAKDGFDAEYGARPLRRSIQNTVEDAVAEQMLEGKLKYGDTAKVTLHDGKVVVEKIPAAEAQAEAIAEEAEEAAGEAESPAEAAEDSPDHPQSAE